MSDIVSNNDIVFFTYLWILWWLYKGWFSHSSFWDCFGNGHFSWSNLRPVCFFTSLGFISHTTPQPFHSCFSFRKWRISWSLSGDTFKTRISDSWTIIMKPLDFLSHKSLIIDSIKALQAGFNILVQSLLSAEWILMNYFKSSYHKNYFLWVVLKRCSDKYSKFWLLIPVPWT